MYIINIRLLSEKFHFQAKTIQSNNNTYFMSNQEATSHVKPNPIDYNQYLPYFYPSQTQTTSLTPIEINMIYLIQQNRFLQEQLIKEKQKNLYNKYHSESTKNEFVKMEGDDSEQQQNSSEDFESQLPQNNIKSGTAFEQRYNKNKLKRIKKVRTQTKNIPKNYGKAIVTFIQTNKQLLKRVITKFPSMSFDSFMSILRQKKRRINTIADLREFWLQDQNEDFPKIARILSNIFLRFYSFQYIFNSRINNYIGHVKYRGRLVEALRNPVNFTSIKQY